MTKNDIKTKMSVSKSHDTILFVLRTMLWNVSSCSSGGSEERTNWSLDKLMIRQLMNVQT